MKDVFAGILNKVVKAGPEIVKIHAIKGPETLKKRPFRRCRKENSIINIKRGRRDGLVLCGLRQCPSFAWT